MKSESVAIDVLLLVARTAAPDQLPQFLGQLEQIRVTAWARLNSPRTPQTVHPDELLNVEQAAKRLGVSKKYLYTHVNLPFAKSVGRRRLFSARGIEQFIRDNKCFSS
jgi:excisionase family DNA binding protein